MYLHRVFINETGKYLTIIYLYLICFVGLLCPCLKRVEARKTTILQQTKEKLQLRFWKAMFANFVKSKETF